ncbi:Ig-like domain-containing protein [Halobacteriovorax sp. DPLXC-1]|uniref:Ig-like domain-containing protein n=1 Tax=Halobacteriovorax sp. DPLXC-1 TaxID=3110771 RepID=UPI002FEFD3A1
MALKDFKKNNDKYLQAGEHSAPKKSNLNKTSQTAFTGTAALTAYNSLAYLRANENYDFTVEDFKYKPSAWKAFDFSEPVIPPDAADESATAAAIADSENDIGAQDDITALLTSSFIALDPGQPDLRPAFPITDIEVEPIEPPTLPEVPESEVFAPNVTFSPSFGLEDTAININVTVEDTSGGEDTIEIRIYNVPENAILSAGTLVADGLENYYRLTVEELNGLTITPPENSSNNFNLSISVITTNPEGTSSDTQNGNVLVTVRPDADLPTAEVTPTALGNEDKYIPIGIPVAQVNDLDGSETLEIRIFDVPEGAKLKGATRQGDYFLVTDKDALQILPPLNSSDNFTLNIQFFVIDRGPDDVIRSTNGETILTVDVEVNPVADIPNLTVSDATGLEDSAIALNINTSLFDTDGSEVLSILVSGIPTGATLSAGIDNGDGSWTLTQEELIGLAITPALNSDEDFSLTVTATATETENSDTASISETINVNVDAVADTPLLTVADATGDEDTAIALSITPELVDTDGSEILNITISNVPAGAVLSAGTNNGDGSWTLTSTQLAALTITPPLNSGDDFTLQVTATSVESENSDFASVTQDLNVTVNAVADIPTLNVTDISVDEDSLAPLNLNIALTDTDGSEFIAKVIITKPSADVSIVDASGVAIGTDLGLNQIELTYEQAVAAYVTPPTNSDIDFQLQIEVFSEETENGDQASATGVMNVTVNSVVDDLIYSSEPLTILEDTTGQLIINAELTDTDGSESVETILSGIPSGSTLSGATDNGDGTWTVTDYDNLILTPIENSDVDFTISITHTVTEAKNGASRVFNDSLNVVIDAVADTPNLATSDATGDEDTAIPLTISASLVDTDGSESLRIGISNVPPNAILSAGTNLGNGNWLLSPEDLVGLTITPPENLSGQVELIVRALATEAENTDQALAEETLIVTVNAVADVPILNVQDASGDEDTAIALNISGQLQDLDGSEDISFLISDVPTGAVLSAGINNGDGTWSLTQSDLVGLTITPPLNSDNDFALNITVTATEGSNSDSQSVSATLNVTVNAVADAPTLSVADASGDEDTAIALSISPSLVDTDASESLSITIGNVPTGAILSAGTDNGDGSWTLSEAQLAGLTITPPLNSGDDFVLQVTATSTEADNNDTASTTQDLNVVVNAVADTPVFTMQDLTVDEDSSAFLSFASLDTTSLDQDGSESYQYFVTGVPDGFIISNATDLGGGRWQTTGLPEESAVVPTPNFDGQVTLTLEIQTTEAENNDTAIGTDDFLVTVEAIADVPNLSVENASGDEDTAIPLTISSSLNDIDGSETLSLLIAGVPTGAVLSAGTDNGDGSWSLTPDQLTGLTITPPLDSGVDFDLTVTAISTETSNSDTAQTSATINVAVRPIADIPTVSADPVTTDEDTAAALNIVTATSDSDGSEVIDNIIITNMPDGATLNAGTNNGDGSWTLSVADLAGLTITPPPNSNDSFTITITTNVTDPGGTSSSASTDVAVTVNAVADIPTLSVSDATGDEDTAIPLSISGQLQDLDGSEEISYLISDVPTGAILSAGTDNGDGTWTLVEADLVGLTITPPLNSDEDFALNVTVTATEGSNSDSQSVNATLNVTVNAVADTPTLSVDPASGNEDSPILLNISPALTDTDGSETLVITIADVPTGATLSAGTNNGDGTWTLTTTDLVGLTITPSLNSGDDFTLKVSATSVEGENSDFATITQDLVVDVVPVADAPILNVDDISVDEDTTAPLNLDIQLTDADGSESISKVTITTTLAGVTFYNSSAEPVGQQDATNPLLYTFTAEEALDLFILPPPNSDLDFQLVVEAFSQEGENLDEASTVGTINVLVNSQVDELIYSSEPLDILEDTSGTLVINAELTDTDGSETLTTILTGIPVGAQISGATDNGDGTWTVVDYDNLVFTPASNSDEDFTISIIHTVVETETAESRVFNDSLDVNVRAVADTPNLTTTDATGEEDTAIALSISPSLVDIDGSEALRIEISNVPLDASLSAGTNLGNGNWILTPAQLVGLTITPPEDLAGQVELTIRALAIESENLDLAVASETLIVTVNADADIPTLNLSDASGDEDTAIALSIDAQLQDLDGSEAISILVSDVPDGALLSAGIDNGDGTWTLTQSELVGLTITPPLNSDTNFALNITATATEATNSDFESVSGTINVTVNAVADAPNLTVTDVTGDEDTAIPLTISTALVDDDTSESVSLTIAGVPIGATLSAGTNNGDGTWTLTSADLVGLTLTPVKDDATDFTLTVTATSEEAANGDRATTTDEILVTVNAVADTPVFTMQDITIDEDGSNFISFASIDSTSLDQDGSETYQYFVTGVPDGFTITNATDLGDGRWQTAGPPQESEVVPPTKFSGEITLTLEILSTEDENGDTATGTDDFLVIVQAVADIPNLTVEAASGDEDTAIPLSITSSLNDTDGSETLEITISGVPTGAILSAGTDNGDGSWTLTPDQLTGLTITPPLDSGVDFDLTVTATSTETSNSDTADISATLSVTVRPIADIPTVSADPVTTDEDTAAALNITTATTDTDGSEIIDNITITNMPTGATLSAGTDNGDGSWTLTQAQLAGLTITPPPNSSDAFTITITTNVTDPGGTSSSASTDTTITVNAVADEPILSLSDVSGDEDTVIPLTISAALQDTDGSESLSFLISDIPAGATLSAGVDNGDGSWTLTQAQLAGLSITPPLNSDSNFSLTVTATSTESSNSDSASATGTLNVTVNAVADAPDLTVSDAIGDEDTAIALNITPTLVDTDGSETLNITIANVPTGATLSAGTNNGDGSWTLTTAQLAGLTITPPLNSDVDFTLQVTATSVEGANSDSASTIQDLNVTVNAVADEPILNFADVNATEDSPSPLNLSAQLFDNDGSEFFAKVIITKPSADISIVDSSGAAIGTDLGNNQIELTYEQALAASVLTALNSDVDFQLQVEVFTEETENGDQASASGTLNVLVTSQVDDLTYSSEPLNILEDVSGQLVINAQLTDTDGSESVETVLSGIPTGALLTGATDNGDGTWTVTDINNLILTPVSDSDVDFTITITHTVTEAKTGATRKFTDSLNVTVDAVADTPNLTTQPASGDEDTAIALSISSSLVDIDGSESLRIGISNVPLNAVLSAGTNLGEGNWLLSPDDLVGLTITPPANLSGQVELTIRALATESENSDQALAEETLIVTVNAVADIPSLTLADATGDEDSAIALSISAQLQDLDGSETLSFLISDVPTGATLSAGTDNGDGSWTLTQAQLTGLTITPPLNSDENFALNVTVTATETSNGDFQSVSGTLNVTVNAVADAPLLTVADATGDEDSAIALSITPELVDTDGSESLSITLSGVPIGATLSSGTDNGDGTWSLTTADLTGLTITPILNDATDFTITVTAVSEESDNGDRAITTDEILVTVNAVADTPVFTMQDLTVNEDEGVFIQFATIDTTSLDQDGSESYQYFVSGVPDGFTITNATDLGGGRWQTIGQPQESQVIPALNFSGETTLTLEIQTTESENNDTAIGSDDFNVTVVAVADVPNLTVADATGDEDTNIALSIASTLNDTDGSESLAITVSGVPAGATLSAGTDNGDGSWSLTTDQLATLLITPPLNYSGSFDLTVTATATEASNNDTATATDTITVTVDAVADPPIINAGDVTTDEDVPADLNISVDLFDTDGSETITSITISGFPSDGVLNQGTFVSSSNGFDTYTFTPEELVGLQYTPAFNSDQDFVLTITANTEDENGTTNSATQDINVIVNAVADQIEVSAEGTRTDEDVAVPINVGYTQFDTDGSEIVTIEATVLDGSKFNVPDDQIISTGPTVYLLTPDQLEGLIYTPPQDFGGTAQITFTAITTEQSNGDFQSDSVTVDVLVEPIADIPTLTNNGSEGDEDTDIPLNMVAEAGDIDGSETVYVRVDNLPNDTTMSGGTLLDDGSYVFTQEEFNNATIRPPLNSDEDFDIEITIVVQDSNGDQVEQVFTETIIVNPVNDGIELTGRASDEEDKLIPLNAKIVFIDNDKSEVITKVEVTIPAGYELETDKDKFPAEDADRVVEIEEGSVDTIKVRPPLNSNVDFVIPITFTTQEVNGGELVQTIDYPVDLIGKVDQPTFTIDELNILEDSTEADAANQFIINFDPATVDSDGSETYEYTFSNVPDGVTLSAGTYIGDGKWTATSDEINNLFIIPSKDMSGSYDIRLDIKITENDGDTATVNQNFKVNVEAVADTPSLAVADNAGDSGTDVKLNIIGAINDIDGSETLTYTITASDTGTFVDSSGNPVGTQDATNPLKYTFTQAQAEDLFFNYAVAGIVSFEVIAQATESSNSDVATTTNTLEITYYDGGNTGDTGVIDVLAQDLTTCEDENVQLNITLIQEQDEVGDINSITLSGLPTGTEIVDSTGVTIGTDNGSGSWTLEEADLADAFIKLPEDYNENFVVDVTYNKTDGSSGIDQSTTTSFNVFVNDVPDFPIITDSTTSIIEDVWGDLNLDIETVGIDDNAVVIVEGLPDGAIFNAGVENNDGTWSINAQDLPTLQVLTKEHDSTDFQLRFEWQVQSIPGCEPSPEDLEAFVTVNVNEVADPVSMNDVVATPNEDEKKKLEFNLELIDRDGSETITSIVITSLPTNGTLTGVNEDGTVDNIGEIEYTPDLNFNGQDFLTIEVTTVDNDGEDDGTDQSTFTTVKTVAINVLPRTDDPRQQFENLTTLEDEPVAIIVDFRDSDLGQDFVYEMTGIPEGSVLSAGINQGGGKWIVVNDEMDGLTITPPLHYSGKFTVDVKTFTEDGGNGDIKDRTENFDVTVEAVADEPEGAGLAVILNEGEDAQLILTGELIDTDGSEILSFEVDGLPSGATLSKGSYDDVNDVWTLKLDETQDLFITDTEGITDDFVITARAVATENSNDDTAFSEFTVNVTYVPSIASSEQDSAQTSQIESIETLVSSTESINATTESIADTPILEVQDILIDSNSEKVALNIDSSLTDDSEVLTFEISNLPEGIEVNAGFFDDINSKWVLDTNDIEDLQLTGLSEFENSFQFEITAISTDSISGDSASVTDDVMVNFNHQNFHQIQAMMVNMDNIESNTTDELASYEANVDEFGDIYIADADVNDDNLEVNESEEDLTNTLEDTSDHELIIENDRPIVI